MPCSSLPFGVGLASVPGRAFERIGDLASPGRRSMRTPLRPYDGCMATADSGALVGREGECAAIDRLLEVSAGEESSSLVLRGEPGIGKTALLSYAAERSRGRTVLRIAGVEAESDLGF